MIPPAPSKPPRRRKDPGVTVRAMTRDELPQTGDTPEVVFNPGELLDRVARLEADNNALRARVTSLERTNPTTPATKE